MTVSTSEHLLRYAEHLTYMMNQQNAYIDEDGARELYAAKLTNFSSVCGVSSAAVLASVAISPTRLSAVEGGRGAESLLSAN